MRRTLILPAALLLSMAACTHNPTAPEQRTPRLDDGPGIGAGVGLVPVATDENGGQLGSGNETRSGGSLGHGN